MSVYPIADYYTVFPSPADIVDFGDGKSIFNIPASAYASNSKGQYCLVSLVDGSLDVDNQELPIIVALENVLNNGGLGVLGNFSIAAQQGASRYHHTFNKNDVKYLIPARPSQLRVKCLTEDQAAFVLVTGYLTFKFEYLSKEAVKAMNEETDYNTF